MSQSHYTEGTSTIFSASSDNHEEIFISVWVYKAPKKQATKRRPQIWTIPNVLYAVIQFGMVLATITVIHQNFAPKVSA